MFPRERLAPGRTRMGIDGVWLSGGSPSSMVSKPNHLVEKSLKTQWRVERLGLSLRKPVLMSPGRWPCPCAWLVLVTAWREFCI